MTTNYIHRTIENKLEEMYDNFPSILITGSRQSGKSTVLQYISTTKSQTINEVSLDDLNERTLAIDDPETFLRTHGVPLIIDEFQYAPNLLSYIKLAIDEARKNEMFGDGKKVGTLYYLTGSQVFETMENITESLAGRVGIIDLYPLSTREISNSIEEIFIPNIDIIRKKEPLKYEYMGNIFERIFRGSYPELYKNKDINLEAFYSSYLRTYIERDIRKIVNIQDEPKFMKFISSLAARTGQEFNASDIAKDIGVDSETVTKWTGILSNTYIIFLLQPHMNNNVGRIIKRPKIYFMDTGLACYLTGYVSSETLQRSNYSGQIFETYIISEIVKSYTNNQRDPKKHLYYYRDNNGKEIDLLILYEDNIYPVEIKKNSNPDKDAIKNFNIVKKFEMNSPNGAVICLTKNIHPIDDKNYMIPIEYI
ncbi:MAG: ATP-binding protein [Clostridia bacterium]|nr:ATP-binding protein [Clostridia bacterium]